LWHCSARAVLSSLFFSFTLATNIDSVTSFAFCPPQTFVRKAVQDLATRYVRDWIQTPGVFKETRLFKRLVDSVAMDCGGYLEEDIETAVRTHHRSEYVTRRDIVSARVCVCVCVCVLCAYVVLCVCAVVVVLCMCVPQQRPMEKLALAQGCALSSSCQRFTVDFWQISHVFFFFLGSRTAEGKAQASGAQRVPRRATRGGGHRQGQGAHPPALSYVTCAAFFIHSVAASACVRCELSFL
jgi:hypothetical protein